MDLKIKDLVELLQVSEKTIYRWLKEKKIPAYKINHQYRFSRAEINEWLLKNKISTTDKILDLGLSKSPMNLHDLLNTGGIYYAIEGKTLTEVIRSAVLAVRTPPDMRKEEIIDLLLQREEMMSTGIGHGIAIPHPRTPVITDAETAGVSICFLKNPVDFKALDSLPVHTLFIILSANPKRHLEILSKISYICQKEEFRNLLKNRSEREILFSYIRAMEEEWLKRKGAND